MRSVRIGRCGRKALEQQQQVDVGGGAQLAIGGRAKQHGGGQVGAEGRLRGGDEYIEVALYFFWQRWRHAVFFHDGLAG